MTNGTDVKEGPRPGKRALTFVLVTVLLDMIGIGLIVPVVPSVLRELTGREPAEAASIGGYLFFAYAFMQFFCSPIIGNLSDAFGRRPVLLFSVLGLGIDYALTALAPSLGWLFVGRIVAGFFGASYSTANAYIADVTEPEERGRAFGLIGAAWGIGFVLGPALGGLLGGFGSRVPFVVAAGLSLANVIFGLLVLPETLPPEKRRPFSLRRANPVGALAAVARVRSVRRVAVALFVFFLAQSVYPAVWTFYTMARYGWGERGVGLSLALYGILGTIVQGTMVGPVIKRLGERRAAIGAATLDVFALTAVGLASRGWVLLTLVVLQAPAGIGMPAMNAVMSKATPDTEQGSLQGAVASLEGISSIVGPIVMTQLFRRFGAADAPVSIPGAPFFASALLTLVAVVLLVRARSSAHEPEVRTPDAGESPSGA